VPKRRRTAPKPPDAGDGAALPKRRRTAAQARDEADEGAPPKRRRPAGAKAKASGDDAAEADAA
jgi:hypothetical protein